MPSLIQSIEHFDLTISGSLTASADLTEGQDLTRCIVLYTVENDTSSSVRGRSQILFALTDHGEDPPSIDVTRINTANVTKVRASVVELVEGFTAVPFTRVIDNNDGATTSVTIADVGDLTKAWAFASSLSTHNDAAHALASVRFDPAETDTLLIELPIRNATPVTVQGYAVFCDADQWATEYVEIELDGVLSNTATLSTNDPDHTFIMATVDTSIQTNVAAHTGVSLVLDGNTLTATRGIVSAGTLTLRIFAITSSDISVQRGVLQFFTNDPVPGTKAATLAESSPQGDSTVSDPITDTGSTSDHSGAPASWNSVRLVQTDDNTVTGTRKSTAQVNTDESSYEVVNWRPPEAGPAGDGNSVFTALLGSAF